MCQQWTPSQLSHVADRPLSCRHSLELIKGSNVSDRPWHCQHTLLGRLAQGSARQSLNRFLEGVPELWRHQVTVL